MIVNDLRIVGVAAFVAGAKPPLVVDTNAVKTGTVALERFEPVAGRHAEEVQRGGGVELGQLALGDPLNRREAPHPVPGGEPLRVLAAEAMNHGANRIAYRDANRESLAEASGRPILNTQMATLSRIGNRCVMSTFPHNRGRTARSRVEPRAPEAVRTPLPVAQRSAQTPAGVQSLRLHGHATGDPSCNVGHSHDRGERQHEATQAEYVTSGTHPHSVSAAGTNRTGPMQRRGAVGVTESTGLVVPSPSPAAVVAAAARHPVDGGPHRSPRIAKS